MQVAVQVVANLVTTGALYTLIAIGLSLIFSVMRIINFAHAQMYMIGAYGVYVLYGRLHLPFVVAVVLSALGTAVIGIVVEWVVIRPVRDDPGRAMIATLGLLLILGGVALDVFGATGLFVDPPITSSVVIGGAYLSVEKLVNAGVALALVVGLFSVLRMTRFGRALRALAQDEMGAKLQGVRSGRSRTLGFAIGAGLAGVAGALVVPLTAATPDMGNTVLLDMFVIIILGGLGSILGAAVGAFILAAFQTVGVTYFGQFATLGVYLLVIAVLLVRPAGVLGRE